MQGLKVELILTLLRNGPKVGPQRRFCDRLSVVVVVLLPLVERLHVNRRDDPRFEPHALQDSADIMGAEASLHSNDAARKLLENGIQGQALDLLAHDQLAAPIEPDQVKVLALGTIFFSLKYFGSKLIRVNNNQIYKHLINNLHQMLLPNSGRSEDQSKYKTTNCMMQFSDAGHDGVCNGNPVRRR